MVTNPISDFVSKINLGSIFNKFLFVLLLIFVVLVGVGLMWLFFSHKKKKKKGLSKKIYWWEEINGKLNLLKIEDAEEVSVPGSSLRLIYVPSSKTWLPRFTRQVSPNVYFVAITPNKEIVNFSLKGFSEDLGKAGLDFDHTDMRWAAENLRDFVKRNYRDKSEKWWQRYAGIVGSAMMILIMTFSFVVIIYFLRGVVSDIGSVSQGIADAAKQLNLCTPAGSGVILPK